MNPKIARKLDEAERYAHQDKYISAIRAYRQCLKIDGSEQVQAFLWQKIGAMYALFEDYQKAAEAFSNAIDLLHSTKEAFPFLDTNEDLSRCYGVRGRCFSILNHRKEAFDDLNEAIRLGFKPIDAYSLRGSWYVEAGEYAKAESDFTKAIELGSSMSDFYNRAASRVKQGKLDDAKKDLEHCCSLRPAKGEEKVMDLVRSSLEIFDVFTHSAQINLVIETLFIEGWTPEGSFMKKDDLEVRVKTHMDGFLVEVVAPPDTEAWNEIRTECSKKYSQVSADKTTTYKWKLEPEGEPDDISFAIIDFIDKAEEYFRKYDRRTC